MGFQYNIAFMVATTIVILNLSTIVAGDGPVSDPCKVTDYPELCNLHVKGKDMNSAIQEMIQATIDQTTQAKEMLSGIRTNSMGELNAQDCKTNYEDAIAELQTSFDNIKAKSRADLKNGLSAVVTYYMTCQDGFDENPDVDNPVSKVNQMLHQLASNNLALADALKL